MDQNTIVGTYLSEGWAYDEDKNGKWKNCRRDDRRYGSRQNFSLTRICEPSVKLYHPTRGVFTCPGQPFTFMASGKPGPGTFTWTTTSGSPPKQTQHVLQSESIIESSFTTTFYAPGFHTVNVKYSCDSGESAIAAILVRVLHPTQPYSREKHLWPIDPNNPPAPLMLGGMVRRAIGQYIEKVENAKSAPELSDEEIKQMELSMGGDLPFIPHWFEVTTRDIFLWIDHKWHTLETPWFRPTKIQKARERANAETRTRFMHGWDGTAANAFLHSAWSYLTAKAVGEYWATQFTDAHEDYRDNPCMQEDGKSKAMDLNNNTFGIQLATDPATAGWSEEQALDFLEGRARWGTGVENLTVVIPGRTPDPQFPFVPWDK